MLRRLTLAAVALATLANIPCALAQLPAFPGADGAARTVTGGRGALFSPAPLLEKNSNDNRPGTLRYGLSDSNFGGQPRTIVFDVAGTFWLGRYGAENGHDNGWDTQSRYNLGSNVTIAGQTAPGPVYIMGGLVKASGSNTILRNVTIAPGYGMRNFSQPEAGVFPTPGTFPDRYVYDAIDISGQRIMIDHVTMVYATDETVSANELADDVTIQFSNISQGQNYPQADAEASGTTYTGHALGSLLQAGSNANISVVNNLYAHQKGRLPRVGSEVGTGAYNDFRNNVFYNWFDTAGSGASGQPSFNNFIGNFYLAGPGGDNPVGGSSTAITVKAGGTNTFNGASSSATRVYHSGNMRDINKDGDALDGVLLTNSNFSSSSIQATPYTQTPYHGVTLSATEAYDRVLDFMGATWWDRGPVDQRIIQEVRTGTGKIMAWADDPFNNDPNEGTEWRDMLALRANPATGAAPFSRGAGWDSDGDGMPDYWELAHNLDPLVADNNGDFDDDGYTNLEEYVNEIAAWPAPRPLEFSAATSNRYAQSGNWSTHWQPSRFDEAQINSGTAVVDAVGQHAGRVLIAGGAADVATLAVNSGWLVVQDQIAIGGTAASQGTLELAGGVVPGGGVEKGAPRGNSFHRGGPPARRVAFSLVNAGGAIAPGMGIGQTRIFGDLTMQAGEIALDVAGPSFGQYDRLIVDGHLAAGGVFSVTLDAYAPQMGDVFDLLDFGSASGGFVMSLPELTAGLAWDVSQLFASGVLAVVAGGADDPDFNGDGFVDGSDFLIWQRGFGLAGQTGNANGDANGNGAVDSADYGAWSAAFGAAPPQTTAVPEPTGGMIAAALAALAYGSLRFARRRPDRGGR